MSEVDANVTDDPLAAALAEAMEGMTNDLEASPALDPLLAQYRNRFGEATGEYHIIVPILSQDPEWAERFRFNTFGCRVEYQDDRGHWAPVNDKLLRAMRMAIFQRYRVVAGTNLLEAILYVAERHEIDPLKDYVLGLHGKWDKKPRLKGLFRHYFKVAEWHSLYEVYALKWFMMAIHRALQPGCAAHVMLVFQGDQGRGKSRGVAALCPDEDWFGQVALHPDDKDTVLGTQGKWICEVAELVGMGKAELESLKFYLSRNVDEIRPPYGRSMEKYLRRCLFLGTTNSDSFLGDPTGSRRYWVVPVEWVDVPAVLADRHQLWAEAYHYYVEARNSGNFVYWLTEEEEAQRAELALQWQHEDPWYAEVAAWLSKNGAFPFTLGMLMMEALGEPSTNASMAQKAGNLLRSLGFLKSRKRVDGDLKTLWVAGPKCKIQFKSSDRQSSGGGS